ncbi:MAG: type II toxin-antitoxin system mRNA interferase toxin, RelE/StbE family [Cytophagaceae bacterium]|nr:type II toxin-antitoxin system mRNA interferase toxin, RelE/StbE family [Cytophagaceae bacterium]
MIKIVSTRRFEKSLEKFKKQHPELKNQYSKTIYLLEENPFHPSLRLHKLQGNLQEFYSVSINMKYRILLDFIIQDDKLILLDIGNHDYLYR